MRKLITILIALVLTLGATSCHKNPVNPAVPSAPETPAVKFERTLLGAADAVDAVSNGLAAANGARKDLLAQGSIDQDYNKELLEYLQIVAAKNEAARQAIQLAEAGNDPGATWSQKLQDLARQADGINPLMLGIKNPDSQKMLQASLATLRGALLGISGAFGGQ